MCSTILPYLPTELIYNIIIRLLVKDIIRFSCVSKLWNRVVRNRGFIKEHHEHSTVNSIHNFTLIDLTYNDEFYSAAFSNYTFGQQKRIEPHPLYSLEEKDRLGLRYRMVAMYNGLLLLQVIDTLRNKYYLALWNMTIAKHRRIPYESKKDERISAKIFGVGYNCDEDDLKVLTLEQCYNINGDGRTSNLSAELKIYCLASNTWESIKVEHPYDSLLIITEPMVLVNNSRVAWVMAEVRYDGNNYENGNYLIVTFDLARKKFHGFTVPLPYYYYRQVKLAALGGFLSIWHYSCAYIMKEEHSWTRLPSSGSFSYDCFDHFQPLLFDADRESVLVKQRQRCDVSGSLKWYNLRTGLVTETDGWRTDSSSTVYVCAGNLRLLLDGHPDGNHGCFTNIYELPLSV